MTEVTYPLSQTNPKQLILGTWNWKYTDLIFEGIQPPDDRVTPESTGHSEQRRFLENGSVEFYSDGQMTESHPYTVEVDDRGTGVCFYVCIGRDKPECQLTGDTLEMWPMGGGACGAHIVYARAETTDSSDA